MRIATKAFREDIKTQIHALALKGYTSKEIRAQLVDGRNRPLVLTQNQWAPIWADVNRERKEREQEYREAHTLRFIDRKENVIEKLESAFKKSETEPDEEGNIHPHYNFLLLASKEDNELFDRLHPRGPEVQVNQQFNAFSMEGVLKDAIDHLVQRRKNVSASGCQE